MKETKLPIQKEEEENVVEEELREIEALLGSPCFSLECCW